MLTYNWFSHQTSLTFHQLLSFITFFVIIYDNLIYKWVDISQFSITISFNLLDGGRKDIVKSGAVVCFCILFLTACIYSKEAKQVKNSKETQAEIETAIKKQAKEK